MEINFSLWLNGLGFFADGASIEGCALMFPILDKAAKNRYPNFGNKKRMSKFMADELERVIALGTGLDLKFNSDRKIIFGTEDIGEVLYRLRCKVLHEADVPDDLVFTRESGVFEFALKRAEGTGPATIFLPDQFCELLHLTLLSCPEYSAIPQNFEGRRIRFGLHEIMPSQCVGNYGILRHQLLFGVN
jgi:hypothetical protein